MKNTTALTIAVAAAFYVLQSASGATTWRLLRSDSDASGVTNAYSWVSTSSNSTHSGEPGEDLSSNEIYLVRGGYILNTLSGNVLDTVFMGKQLTLGQTTTSTGRVRQRAYGAARTTWDNWGANTGLILAYGLYEAYAGSGTTSEIYGKVRVNSDASMPYILSFSYANTRMNWHGDFTCAEDKVLRVEGVNYSGTGNPLVSGATLGLLGSLEGFYGTMAVSNVTVCVGDGSLSGTLSFEGGGGLSVTNSASDTFTVGNLSMAGDISLSVSARLNEAMNAVAANSKIVVTNSFAASGKMEVSFNLSAGVTNMVLDFLLVGVLRGGLVAAAVATIVGQTVGGLIPLIYFASKKNKSPLRLGRFYFNVKELWRAVTNGFSEFVTNISASIVGMVYNAQLLRYAGEDGVSAYGVLMYVGFIFLGFFFGYSVGSSPVISYHYGAKNTEELRGLFRKSLVLITSAGVMMTALSLLLARPLSMIFVSYDAALLDMTVRAMRLYATCFLLFGFNVFASSFFTALNNGFLSAVISVSRTFVMQIAAVLLLPLLLGLDGIWLAVTAAEGATMILSATLIGGERKRYGYGKL